MQFQLLNFRQHRGGLVFQGSALRRVVFRRILARTVLEIQVAKILVQDVFLFAQEIQSRLRNLSCRMPLGIEHEGKDREQKNATRDGAHIWVSRRMRSRVAVNAGVSGTAGIGTVRSFQLRTISKTPAMPRNSINGGMIQAT